MISYDLTSLVRQIHARPYPIWDDSETRLLELLERGDGLMKEDLSIRLERCVQLLIDAQTQTVPQSTSERNRIAISEILHGNVLNELRGVLGEVLSKKNRVAILIDNLDKAWDKRNDLNELSEFLFGLVGIADKITRDLRSSNAHYKSIKVSLAIFLRSDIFYRAIGRDCQKNRESLVHLRCSHRRSVWPGHKCGRVQAGLGR